MNNEERRKCILEQLKNSSSPISATSLAGKFSVTRQIIVADIALLRAGGSPIRAEHKGYVLDKPDTESIIRRLVVKHGKDEVKEELYAIVDNGGKVIDVIIEHSIYGKISAELNHSSRYDVDKFIKRINETGAYPLSQLTAGLHIHTIAVKDDASYDAIIERLAAFGVLIDYE